MTHSNTTYYCPACEREGATKNRWLHQRTPLHVRNVNRLFPRPENPWAANPLKPIDSAKGLPHLGYLKKPSKK